MAEKKNYSEIQRTDRTKLVRIVSLISLAIGVLLVLLFLWHYLAPKEKKQETTVTQSAQLTMVPTSLKYHDVQAEKTYDVGTTYIILSDGNDGYMKVSSDGNVTKVSSDGTYLGSVTEEERKKMLESALRITESDNQANMALSGLQTVVDTTSNTEIPSDSLTPSTLDMIYQRAEELGYTKDSFIRATYLTGGTPEDAARLIESGANTDEIIKAVMASSNTQKEEETKNKGLSIEIERVGIEESPVTVEKTEETTYPEWLQEVDPTSGMSAVLETLSNAVSTTTDTSTWNSVNKQGEKESWQNNQQTTAITSSKLTRYDLVAGTTVPITIVTGINTDLPGSVVGIVRQDVYDTLTGTNVLIPKGSRLMATYNSSVSFGQQSVQIAWTTLITPDGYQFSLPGFSGTTPDGYSGVAGSYNSHFWQMLGGAMLGSLIDWGSVYATDTVGNLIGGGTLGELLSALTGSAINTTSSVGQQYAQMWANLQPTIKIKTGTQTQLLVNQTISLKR